MIGRRLLVVAVALLIAIEVVRNAVVVQLAPFQPAAAARVWANHPQVEISLGMAQIAEAVQHRTAVGQATFAMIDRSAAKSPLSPEPFLVHGVQAQLAGDTEAARRAFADAQWRDPRSVPAAYFLAEYNLRSGHLLEGLRQTALLSRLLPQTTATIAPFLASYAQNPATWPQIKELFRTEHYLEGGVLEAMAQDPRNADAILALADAEFRQPNSSWLPILLGKLVAAGDYGKAKAIWTSIGRGRTGGDLIYDASFSAPESPPPFNWELESSTIGLAERQPGKKLHVLFYGNQDGVLASQLVMLPPGAYRLQMQVIGSPQHPEQLSWSVRCANSNEPFASAGIGEAAARSWTFQVPPDCPAQWIALSGRTADVAQQSDVVIGGLSLGRINANAQ